MRTLRTENTTFQQRLDEQRHLKRDLSAKLQLASRVTDLIFKMRVDDASGAPAPSP